MKMSEDHNASYLITDIILLREFFEFNILLDILVFFCFSKKKISDNLYTILCDYIGEFAFKG